MEKFKSFMERLKKNILIYLVVWIILAILLVAPMTFTYTNSIADNMSPLFGWAENLGNNFLQFPITRVFEDIYITDFIKGIKLYSILYWIIIGISIKKTLPKSAFDKIEHGSSDWCQPGEQYKVLSKKSGLILAKDNYLPVDKPGNVNVLIVGRIWCW